MLEMVDVYKAFGAQPVLRGVSLRVPKGTTYAMLGISGSGKTVVLKHFVGLLHPDRGVVRVEGEDLSRMKPRELEALHRKFGVLFQSGALFDSMTVAENLALPLREQLHLSGDEIQARVQETLALVDLRDVEQKLPGELSGGMRKRVAFARAIVHRPKILVYDEPTAGLDPLTTEYVADALLQGKNALGMTALVITHDLPTAFRVADRVGLLHEGRIVEEGAPERFRQSRHPAVVAFLKDWIDREAAARELGTLGGA